MTAPFDQVVLERADMIRYALKTGFDKYLLSLSAHGERYGAVLVKDLPQPRCVAICRIFQTTDMLQHSQKGQEQRSHQAGFQAYSVLGNTRPW
jgi:hypothetical protein